MSSKYLTNAFENQGFNPGDDRFSNYNGNSIVQRGAYKQRGSMGRVFVPLSIMAIELFERMTYFTITSGIIFYTVLNLNYNIHTNALMALAIFSGSAYALAPIGGIVADNFLGRFYTILLSTIIYIAGLSVLVTGSFDASLLKMEEFDLIHRDNLTLAGLALIIIGTGGIKANVAPFGADQIRALGDETVTSYFNWYYFVINIGTAVAVMGVSHLQTEKYMGTGLLIPLCGMTVSLLVFAGMHRFYVKFRPERHNVGKIMCQGCSKCSSEGTWFAGAMERNGGSQPDRVVMGYSSAFKTGLLANFVMLVWLAVHLLNTASPFQAERMDRNVGSFEIPEWLYRSFYPLAVLLAIPFLALGVLPLFRDLKRFNLTLPRRIGLGIVLVALGMFVSGAVEMMRKDTFENGEYTVKEFPPAPIVLEYMANNPTAMEIVKNVTENEIEAFIAEKTQKGKGGTDSKAPVANDPSVFDDEISSDAAGGDSSVAEDVPSNSETSEQKGPVVAKESTGENEVASAVTVEASDGAAASETSDGAAVSETSGGAAASETSGGAAASETSGGAAASETSGGAAASETSGGAAASETSGGAGASETSGGAAASETSGGAAASETSSGAAASETSSGAAASETSGGAAASETSGGAAASETSSGAAASETSGGAAASETSGGAAASETSGGANSPNLVFQKLMQNMTQDEQNKFTTIIMPALSPMLPKISDALKGPIFSVLPELVPVLLELPDENITYLMDMFPGMLQSFNNIQPEMLKAMMSMLPQMLPQLVNMSQDDVEKMMRMLPDLLPKLLPLMDKLSPEIQTMLMSMLPQMLPQLESMSQDDVEKMMGMLPDLLPKMLPLMKNMSPAMQTAMMSMLPQMLPQLVKMSQDDVEKMMGMLPDLLPKMLSLMENMSPAMQTAMMSMLPQMLPQLVKMSQDDVEKMMGMLPDLLPKMLSLMENMSPAMQTAMMSMLPQMLPQLVKMSQDDVEAMMGMLPELLPKLLPLMKNMSSAMQTAMMSILPQMLPQLVKMSLDDVKAMMDILPQMLPQLVNMSQDDVEAMMGMLPELLPKLLPLMKNMSSAMQTAMMSMLPQMLPQLVKMSQDDVEAMMGMLPELLPKLLPLMKNMSSAMQTAMMSMLPQMLPQLVKMSPNDVNTMMGMLPKLVPKMLQLMKNMSPAMQTAMMSMLPQMLPQLVNMSQDDVEAMMGMLPQMLPLMEKVDPNMLQPMMEMLPSLLPQLLNLPEKDLKSMMEMLPNMLPLLRDIPPLMLTNMMGMLPQMLPMMEGVPPEMVNLFMGELPKLLPVLATVPSENMTSTMGEFMQRVQNNAGMMVAVHLVLNTPDGFPLWKVRPSMNVSNMSVLTQIPQFMLVGIGEALAAVAGFELAYHQAPFAFQGYTTGMFVLVVGIGHFTVGSLITTIDGWTEICNPYGLCAGTWFSPTGGDINSQNMHYMLFLVAGLVSLAAFLYILVTSCCYRVSDPMSFGEMEEPELPGIELKDASAEDMKTRANYGY